MKEYKLLSPKSEDDWNKYHELRRVILFENRGRFGVYNTDHPDEKNEKNHPKLVLCDGSPVGTVRIDFISDEVAVLRLVTIDQSEQGKGHGKKLLELSQQFSKDNGKSILATNAANESVGYYYSFGFQKNIWSKNELDPKKHTQLTKQID